MAVKAVPQKGEILEETTRTRVLPDRAPEEEPAAGTAKYPPFWDFLESLTPEDWNSKQYQLSIYRGTRISMGPWCGKFEEPMTLKKIRSMWGGGNYVVYLRCPNDKLPQGPPGKQLRYCVEVSIEGLPKTPAEISASSATVPVSPMENALLTAINALRDELRAARGGAAAESAIMGAVNLNQKVFEGAVPILTDTLKAHAAPAASVASSEIQAITAEFMRAAISRLLTPPTTNALQETLTTADPAEARGCQASEALYGTRSVPLYRTPRVQGGTAEYRLLSAVKYQCGRRGSEQLT